MVVCRIRYTCRRVPVNTVIQLTLTLKMTTAQVVETSVTVNDNSPIQDYVNPDDQTQPTNIIIIVIISIFIISLVIIVGP